MLYYERWYYLIKKSGDDSSQAFRKLSEFVGQLVKEYREENNLSVEELAEQLEVPKTVIKLLEGNVLIKDFANAICMLEEVRETFFNLVNAWDNLSITLDRIKP